VAAVQINAGQPHIQKVSTMSFRLSTLLTAGILGLALAGTGHATADDGSGKSCGGKKDKDTSAAVEPAATDALAAHLSTGHRG
jgi:hypothetical protein